MEITNDIDFIFTLNPHGWSTFRLYIKNVAYEIPITHVFGEPYYDLIKSLSKLINGEKQASFIWSAEPGGEKVEFKRLQERHDIVQVSINGFSESYGEEIKEFEKTADFLISKKQLILTFYFQLRKSFELLKDKNYAKDRRNDFPFRDFQDFETLITEKVLKK